MDKYDASYFLGPEFQKDSSMLKPLADALVLSQDQCGLDVLKAEFFLVFVEYSNLLRTMAQIRAKYGIVSGQPCDENARKQAAAEFRKSGDA